MPSVRGDSETIAAIATPPGRGGIGIVRISGKNLRPLAEAICGAVPPPRYAAYGALAAADGSAIDSGLALYFVAPYSFTGEDVLELHGHGGPAVLQLLLRRCLDLGARLAEPGEFTQRAFLNDKIDLAQAESVADLIDASSSEAAKSAMRSLSGEFSREIGLLVEALIRLRTLIEATLDFPEEEIDFLHQADALGQLKNIRLRLDGVLAQSAQGAVLRDGLRVVLIGQPNVGKSSLLNRLAGEELAIVTPIAGTTRDSVSTLIHVDGLPLHITDTAGLRDSDDKVEKIGIERTWAAINAAGLAVLLIDATRGVAESDRAILAKLPANLPVVTVLNKIDLVADSRPTENILSVSAKTGQGLESLRSSLFEAAGWRPPEEGVFMARERHLAALKSAKDSLAKVQIKATALELAAEELRLTQVALSSITGEFTADDLLGEIFSRFCIGK
ncbi:MAG: tRNA uridine-5-carboxymethylaminomethyl(34) synthesis GTPase MnmE [Burkholderiales bacterium]|nr:tRNA uridine-5-carboxymethylaminomethyl(34) synthesis GTPase MnmE [Burkholderiales bacterium]